MQAAAWVVGVSFLWAVDTLSKISYRNQTGIGKENFRLIVEQASSATAALIMILFVVQWLRLFPIRRDAWVPAVIGHSIGTVIFAFGHYSLMVLFRIVVYGFYGVRYSWVQDYVPNLIVEYQKDIKIYVGIVIVLSAYQIYSANAAKKSSSSAGSRRMVVQTGSGERVVNYADIDYLEASRNYVSIHVAGKEYLVRDTISNVEKQLVDGHFARTHRSFIVNIDKISELRGVDSGYRIFLESGVDIPLSRSFRDSLKLRMTG